VKGNALANASFGRPVSRQKAQREFDAFLARVAEVNADNDLMWSVAYVDLFGSFLDPTIDPVGDIDLAIELRPKWSEADDVDAWRRTRLDATAPRWIGYSDSVGPRLRSGNASRTGRRCSPSRTVASRRPSVWRGGVSTKPANPPARLNAWPPSCGLLRDPRVSQHEGVAIDIG
jgi:hypothetical protein